MNKCWYCKKPVRESSAIWLSILDEPAHKQCHEFYEKREAKRWEKVLKETDEFMKANSQILFQIMESLD